MARTKQTARKTAKKSKKLPAGAQNAEAFLRNGSKNAAKALKKNAKQIAKPPRAETRAKIWKHSRARPRGTADPTLLVKEAVAQSKHQTYYEIVDNTEKKQKKLEFQVRSGAPFEEL